MVPQTRNMLKRAAALGLPAITIETPQHMKQESAAGTFRLMDLPQEFVDMIYIEMVRAGDVGILRASSQVHEQASKCVKLHGVYRITVEDKSNGQYMVTPGEFIHPKMPPIVVGDVDIEAYAKPPRTVQSTRNIQVRVDTKRNFTDRQPLGLAHYFICYPATVINLTRSGDRVTALACNDKRCFGVLGGFISSTVQYDTCRILVESDIGDIGALGTQWLLKGISMLTSFDWMYMEFKKGVTPRGYGWDASTAVPYSKKKEMPFFEMVKQQLVGTLGPAVLVEGDEPVMIFRPQKFQAALAAGCNNTT